MNVQNAETFHPVQIVTYRSANAPEGYEWLAKWVVPVKPSKRTRDAFDAADDKTQDTFQTNPSKQGFMPYSFSAPSEEEVIEKARAAWNGSFGKRAGPKKKNAEEEAA